MQTVINLSKIIEGIKMNRIITLAFLIISTAAMPHKAWGYSQDTSTISLLYVAPDGSVSFTLTNNFQNARTSSQCPTSNGFAGSPTMTNMMKSTLLAARSVDKPVTITIDGCTNGGTWFKVLDIYY